MLFKSAPKRHLYSEKLQNHQNKDYRKPMLWGVFTPESPHSLGPAALQDGRGAERRPEVAQPRPLGHRDQRQRLRLPLPKGQGGPRASQRHFNEIAVKSRK